MKSVKQFLAEKEEIYEAFRAAEIKNLSYEISQYAKNPAIDANKVLNRVRTKWEEGEEDIADIEDYSEVLTHAFNNQELTLIKKVVQYIKSKTRFGFLNFDKVQKELAMLLKV